VNAPVQLNMNFAGGNSFATDLGSGKFVILLEQNTPDAKQPLDSAVTIMMAMAKKIRDYDIVSGFALTDRLTSEDTHDSVEIASRLQQISDKPVVLHLSGKGSDEKRVRNIMVKAHSANVTNILAVTGDRSANHCPDNNLSNHFSSYCNGYLDSVEILRFAKRSGHGLFVGAGVNPFKYNPADQYLQYFKMIRKLHSGASFITTQIGWDMKKYQELQWYLQMREMTNPVIARVMLLSLDDINNIHKDFRPGVHVPRRFAAMLQRESSINSKQSLATQVIRLGLQIAGCRLLGYSGVQIVGVRDLQVLDLIVPKIEEALSLYTSYSRWLVAWNDFHEDSAFSQGAGAYYVYSNLLSSDLQQYDATKSKLTDRELLLEGNKYDNICSKWASYVFSDRSPKRVQNLVKGLFYKGCGRNIEELKYCCYLNPSACPKNLVYGACGGSLLDGGCEFSGGTCFFHRVLAIAARQHTQEQLEKGIVD